MTYDNNGDFIRRIIAIQLIQKYALGGSAGNAMVRSVFGEQEDKELLRHNLESHPSIKSKITDKDMLHCRIDWALETRDMELFMNLTNKLKEFELVK